MNAISAPSLIHIEKIAQVKRLSVTYSGRWTSRYCLCLAPLHVQAKAGAGDHSAAFEEMIPRHQPAVSCERFIAAAQVELPARMQELEIQFAFTQWVNQ